MNLLGLRAKKPEAPKPIQQEVHHHVPTNWGMVVVVITGCILFGLWAGWYGFVFLLGEAGVHRPERALAVAVLWLLGITVLIVVGNMISTSYIDRLLAHKQVMKRLEIELAEKQAKLNQSKAIDRRVTDPNIRRLHDVVEVVMFEAYSRDGAYGPTEPRPWARRNAGQVVLAGEKEPVGETLGGKVGAYLRDHSIIEGPVGREQVNFELYPDLASVQRRMYEFPIVYR